MLRLLKETFFYFCCQNRRHASPLRLWGSSPTTTSIATARLLLLSLRSTTTTAPPCLLICLSVAQLGGRMGKIGKRGWGKWCVGFFFKYNKVYKFSLWLSNERMESKSKEEEGTSIGDWLLDQPDVLVGWFVGWLVVIHWLLVGCWLVGCWLAGWWWSYSMTMQWGRCWE